MNAKLVVHEYRGDPAAWGQVLFDVYKPQASTVLDPRRLGGRIRQWEFGAVEVSDYECGAMRFLREARHVGPGCEDHYFVSMPYLAGCTMRLTQEGRRAQCMPGQLVVQHTARPSELVHPAVGALIVRMPGEALRARYRDTVSRVAVALPCVRSAGALFASLAAALVENATYIQDDVRSSVADRLMDLLAIALESRDGDSPLVGRSVHDAHRLRAQRYIRHAYRDPALTPAVVAAACGISVRYLHEIFRSGDVSVFESIMETRLQAARSMLETALGGPKTVSEIAYLCGFRDVAHFSRRFRRQFNAPPRDFLRRGR